MQRISTASDRSGQDGCQAIYGRSIAELLEAQAGRAPHAVALSFRGLDLTYEALNARANQLARHLVARGVGPDVPVGILLNRSLDMVVSVLAVLKAGGAYVPLDPGYPRDRLGFMAADADLAVLLTHGELESSLCERCAAVVNLDEDWPAIAREQANNLGRYDSPEDLAYVLYTSGSTGRPKGVQVTRRALLNFLHSVRAELAFSDRDVVLAITSLSFDISVVELVYSLTEGARVVLATRELTADGPRLLQMLANEAITVLQGTPSTWRMLVESGWDQGLALKKGISGGEALPRKLANEIIERGVELWNGYGPTETTVYSTMHRVAYGEGAVPIGRPIQNTTVHLLDEHLRPVARGEVGEIFLGGAGLARGYLNLPELTATRFIPDALMTGSAERLYRTGDLARYLPSGEIEYVGRADHQVKIHGHRIEPGEIEARITAHSSVGAAVVTAAENPSGDKCLVAYVVPRQGASVSATELRPFLAEFLPKHMVPSAYICVAQFPLTPTGKVDRKALPAPDWGALACERPWSPAETDTQRRLQAIWQNVLKVAPIGIEQDFFEIGGDSLSAVRLMIQIEAVLGRTLPMAALYQYGTIEKMAGLLDSPEARTLLPTLVPVRPVGTTLPLVLVHGLAGTAISFVSLARALGPEQAVLAFRAPGLLSGEEPFETVRELAAFYRRELLAAVPRGPFVLAGWSFGGVVAYEMAQQLWELGHRRHRLVIIDEVLPGVNRGFRWLSQLPNNAARNIAFNWRNGKRGLRPVLNAPWRLGMRIWNRGGRLGAYLVGQALSVPRAYDTIRQMPGTYIPVINAHLRAFQGYRPQPYAGPGVLIRTKQQPTISAHGPDMGWRSLVRGGLEVRVVPGDHASLLKQPDVRVLAAELARIVEQAGGGVRLNHRPEGSISPGVGSSE